MGGIWQGPLGNMEVAEVAMFFKDTGFLGHFFSKGPRSVGGTRDT